MVFVIIAGWGLSCANCFLGFWEAIATPLSLLDMVYRSSSSKSDRDRRDDFGGLMLHIKFNGK